MNIANISLLGWIHTVACLIALPTGLVVIIMAKGTLRHRRVGLWYFWSMVAANLTAFGLYAPIQGIEPGFNRFHWIALETLIALGLGFYAAPRQRSALWAYAHPVGMVLSVFSLVGGAINEAFARIHALTPLMRGPIQGMTQGVNAVIFFAVLCYLLGKVSGQRTRHLSVAI